MKIDILNLKDGVTGYYERLTTEDLDLEGMDFTLKGPAETHIVVEKGGNKVKMQIITTFTLEMRCSRCLEPFEKSFKTEDTYFIRPGKEEETEEKYLTDEDVFTLFAPTQEVDTVPLVRDSIILSYPMKPLCREDCKGLCPVCGVNLNYSTCEHVKSQPESQKEEDGSASKWKQALEELKKRLKNV